jgi:RecA/RadA recombinase
MSEKEKKTPRDKLREMLKTGEGWEEFDKQLKQVEVSTIIQPLAEENEREKILKTNTVLDDLFGGGLSVGQTVELYGEFATGKSQTIFTLIVEAATLGTVIMIDTEDTFSRKRIIQIAKERGKDTEKISNNIILYKPDSWEQQLAIPAQIPDPLPMPLRLIIEDSLMALFRSSPEFAGRSNLGKRQELIRWHLRQLKRLAKEQGAIVVYTNQVYDEPVANPFAAKWASQMPAGGHSIAHIGDYRIFLRKARGNVRIARLVDNSELPPLERIFQINEKGIDDLSEEQQKEAVKREEKFEKEHTMGELVKKKPKKKTDDVQEIVTPTTTPTEITEENQEEETKEIDEET